MMMPGTKAKRPKVDVEKKRAEGSSCGSVARTHTRERSQSGLAGVTFSPGQTVTMLDGYAGIILPGPEVRVVKLARMLGPVAGCVPMLRTTSCVMHLTDPVEARIKRAADVAEIEHSAAIVQHSSADYYALIARALAHLKENTSESRRSIYAHAETQLVRELRVLDPPLPEAEITSERLSLHEAIRRVEAEAVRSRLEFLVEKRRDLNCEKNTEAHADYPDRTSAAAEDYSPAADDFKQASGRGTVVFAIGRTAIVITFIVSGVLRLMDVDGSATMIASKMLPLPEPFAGAAASIEATLGMPFAQALAIAGPVVEILAGALMAIGIFIRSASLALIVFTAISIYWFQNSWDLQGGANYDEIIRALNELSVVGALLILLVAPRPHAPGISHNSNDGRNRAQIYVRRV
jgi:putative oxidoreductase